MFKKFLVTDQFYNEIVVQVKIPIQMDFYECLKKLRKNSFLNELAVQVKIPI